MVTTTFPEHIRDKAAVVSLLALDVDGILTDGRLYFSENGEAMKSFHILDGHGIKMLRAAGIEVAIITGRQSGIVSTRAAELGIELIFQGSTDKAKQLDAILRERGLALEQAAFMGDDLPDLPCIIRAGLGITVPNAHQLVLERADCITSFAGGAGAVRQAADWLLQAQDKYDSAVEPYIPD